jgi:flagellar biosynthesis/type III secretory pathway protein FliH
MPEITQRDREKAEEIVGCKFDDRKQKPTHGTCCTCQKCGFYYDDCKCSSNAEILKIEQSLAEAREEGRIEGMKEKDELWRRRFASNDAFNLGKEEGRQEMKEKASTLVMHHEGWNSYTFNELAEAIRKL